MMIDEQLEETPTATPDVAKLRYPTRRHLLKLLAGLGVGSSVFQRALAAQAEQAPAVTAEMIQQAEWIAGLKLSEDDRKAIVSGLSQTVRDFAALRAVKLTNDVPPALTFHPAPWVHAAEGANRGAVEPITQAAPKRPDTGDDLAFLPVTALATTSGSCKYAHHPNPSASWNSK